MGLLSVFKRRKAAGPGTGADEASAPDRGFLVFDNTSEVIRAEKVLGEAGWRVKVMGPPPEIRTGCDLVIEFPLMEKLEILRLLDSAGNPPLSAVPVTGPLLDPVDLYQVKDFGEYVMVRAANMKITVDKATRVVVNVSGGGCPDVPYLARRMTGLTLEDAPSPRELGHTLCGYALHLAYEEVIRLCSS